MNSTNVAFGKACEEHWLEWLMKQHKHMITRLSEATGNHARTGAPLITLQSGRSVAAPDFVVVTTEGKLKLREYHEVKGRHVVARNVYTGEHEHGISYERFCDYTAVQEEEGTPVVIVLYEEPSGPNPGRWLRAELSSLAVHGRKTKEWYGDGPGWVWPVSCMDLVDDCPPLGQSALRVPAVDDASAAPATQPQPPINVLDALAQKLGMSTMPLYSVFRAGPVTDEVLDDVEACLSLGIRVFLAVSNGVNPVERRATLARFRKVRLLECECVGGVTAPAPDVWRADGHGLSDTDKEWLEAADSETRGGINARQFAIVHASPEAHIEVQAGAGTGKTETMVERILFLLATARGTTRDPTGLHPYTLQPEDITMVTFTQDAAKQMRDRLSRQLALRSRLCTRPVHPVLAWMGRVSAMPISTIHRFARSVIDRHGDAIGIAPGFALSQLTMQRRGVVAKVLSDQLGQRPGIATKKAFHECQKLIDSVMQQLSRGGVRLIQVGAMPPDALDWGTAIGGYVEWQGLFEQVVAGVRQPLGTLCREEATFGVDDLIPLARSALEAASASGAQVTASHRGGRFLFVDEFQDTDPLQMDLFLQFVRPYQTKLFYVGDKKQGIYRFRGAYGDAFAMMRMKMADAKLLEAREFSLVRNFRTGKRLLRSFDRPFEAWGGKRLLAYQAAKDRLLSDPSKSDTRDESMAFARPTIVARSGELNQLVCDVRVLRAAASNENIAVLCRTNWQALEAKRELDAAGFACDVATGGDFYQSRPVRELQAFLAAVVDPEDDAAVLQALETAWGPLVWSSSNPTDGATLAPWSERARGVYAGSPVDDLTGVRNALRARAEAARTVPVLAFLFDSMLTFDPASAASKLKVDREAYQRGLDHLLAQATEKMRDASLSLPGFLEWLRIKTATDKSEDFPMPPAHGATLIAITAHRAKGQEYQHVIVPYTAKRFSGSKGEVEVVVDPVVGSAPSVRVWWRLPERGANGNHFPGARDVPWAGHDEETQREETRLLYVAMTRAKKSLRIYRLDASGNATWGQLLQWGGR